MWISQIVRRKSKLVLIFFLIFLIPQSQDCGLLSEILFCQLKLNKQNQIYNWKTLEATKYVGSMNPYCFISNLLNSPVFLFPYILPFVRNKRWNNMLCKRHIQLHKWEIRKAKKVERNKGEPESRMEFGRWGNMSAKEMLQIYIKTVVTLSCQIERNIWWAIIFNLNLDMFFFLQICLVYLTALECFILTSPHSSLHSCDFRQYLLFI